MASLAILLLLARISGSIAISSSSYYISRSSQQLIIASAAPFIIPDADGQSAQQPFLTSPSGSYAAYLRRAADTNSAGGLAGAACYVQIQQARGEGSVWESDCTPVGGADACDLAFSPVGLELFAGGHSLWDTGVDADPATLSLGDEGDMSILSKEGVTVWKASGEPWTGQQCGEAPVAASSTSSPSTDALPPLSATTSTKLVTPPAATLAGTGSTDFSLGDQLAPPPVDAVTAPDLPVQPPVDPAPEQPLAPPPAYVSPDLLDPSLAPPPADVGPDLPLAPPPADVSPDQPPLAPAALPPFGIPLAPPPGTGEASPDAPISGAGSPGGVPFSTPPPGGLPHKQGSPHHDLPVGASPPLPDTLAPGGHGEGAGGVPLGHGQPQQGAFGQQPQLLDGEGHPLPLEDSAGGRSRSERGTVAVGVVLAALIALCSGF